MKTFGKLTAFAAAMGWMVTGQAATVTLDSPLLFGGGIASTLSASPFSPASPGAVGALTGSLSGAPGYSFLTSSASPLAGVSFTFCVELNQASYSGSDSDYSIYNPSAGYTGWGANGPAISAHIDKLMSLALPTINASTTAAGAMTGLAALQYSIWEVIYDYNPSFMYSLSAGALQANTNAAVLAQASAWLAAPALSAAVPTAHYFVVSDPSHQDLLAVAAVPEPASYALMALGLLAVGGVAKRRVRL